MSQAYRQRGVSSTKEEVHRAIAGLEAGLFPGAFCKLVPDVAGDPAFASALHADGAGTKVLVAYLDWKEHGRVERFHGIAQDSAAMNVDDLVCVGATEGFLLSNTIGRNAQRVDGTVVRALVEGYERFAALLRAQGIGMRTAGGETADVGDLVQTLIVDSTVHVRLPRAEVIDLARLRPGLAIVGLSSTGRASYEEAQNSGIGSNGLTLARHVLLAREYAARYPETYAATLRPEHVYGGDLRLEDELPGGGMSVADALLSPTRTYAPILREMLRRARLAIAGIVHCTGGGQAKCLGFGRGLHYVKDELFPVPPLFRAIRERGALSLREMHEVFNMGHRMELYCEPEAVSELVSIAGAKGVEARRIGRIEPSSEPGANQLSIECEGESACLERRGL